MEQTYLDMFLQGGIIMVVLLILSVISLAIIIERLIFIYRHNSRVNIFLGELKSRIAGNDNDRKEKVISEAGISVSKYLNNFRPDITNPSSNKEIIENIISDVESTLKRRTHALIFIIQLAPLLGILGTVLGLAEAFLSIGNLGGAEKFQFLSSGIGKALSTTIAGLVIAAYTMCGHYLIRYRTSKANKTSGMTAFSSNL